MDANHPPSNEADELLRAELAVEQSRAELARSLRRVGTTSDRLLKKVGAELKPGVIVAAVAVGAVVVTGVTVALARRRHRGGWLLPEPPSRLGVAAKAVGVWLLRIAARKAAQALVARLQSSPASASAAPAAQ